MNPTPFNLPPGVSLNDIEGYQAVCIECGRPLKGNDTDTCARCRSKDDESDDE